MFMTLKMCSVPFAAYFGLQLTMFGNSNCCKEIINPFADKFFHLIKFKRIDYRVCLIKNEISIW